ncbi:MAG: RNA polymerase sigma factor region1.1 domain-containing protein, partial [Desulfotignum sp.]
MTDKPIKSEEDVVISEAQLQQLIEKGKKNGMLSYAEINDALSDDLKSSDQIDDIVVQLQDHGIKLVDLEKVKDKKTGSRAAAKSAGKAGNKKEKIRQEMKHKKKHAADGKDLFAPARDRAD